MTFKERFVFVVKSQGRILRERDGGVEIPFGTNYSLLLKNLESRKALVDVQIDGKSIGKRLIIEPNTTIELERFLEDLNQGNKFRFIQKTKEVIEHRGDRIDDGIVRVEVWFEQKVTTQVVNITPIYHPPICPWCHHYPCTCWHYHWQYPYYTPACGVSVTFTTSGGACGGVTNGNAVNCSAGNSSISNSGGYNVDFTSTLGNVSPEPNKDEGITVKGEISNQQFRHGDIGALEDTSTVLILKLRGYKGDNTVVSEPLTVKDSLICSTCGRSSKSDQKYCGTCGTFLS